MKIYEDKYGTTHVLLLTPHGRKALGPFRGKPVPVMRWSSLSGEVITTFSGAGQVFTIRQSYDEDGTLLREEHFQTAIDDMQDVLTAGYETYYWEGWNTVLNQWEEQERPQALEWTGDTWRGLSWRDE